MSIIYKQNERRRNMKIINCYLTFTAVMSLVLIFSLTACSSKPKPPAGGEHQTMNPLAGPLNVKLK